MMHKGKRSKGGTMPVELQEKVDGLMDEFVALADRISNERHLQRGMARASMPCSIVAVVDDSNLSVLAQFRSENLSSTYLYAPEARVTREKAISAARWEFGFEDPFVLQFPKSLLDEDTERRREKMEELAAQHVDAEFKRFLGIINLLRNRPVFGPAPFAPDYKLLYVALPPGEEFDGIYDAIERAAEANKLSPSRSGEVLSDSAKVHEMWVSLSMARLVIADLSGADPTVMYQLGVAHTLGRETVLLYQKSSAPPQQIPHTMSIAYEKDGAGKERLEQDLTVVLKSAIGNLVSS